MAGELEILQGSTRLVRQSEAPDRGISQNGRHYGGASLSRILTYDNSDASVSSGSGGVMQENEVPQRHPFLENNMSQPPPSAYSNGQSYGFANAPQAQSQAYEAPQASNYNTQPYAQTTPGLVDAQTGFDFAQTQSFLMDFQGDDNNLAVLTHLPADAPLFAGSLNSPSTMVSDPYGQAQMFANLSGGSASGQPEAPSIDAYDMAAWQMLMDHAGLGNSIMGYNPFPDRSPSSSSA